MNSNAFSPYDPLRNSNIWQLGFSLTLLHTQKKSIFLRWRLKEPPEDSEDNNLCM